MARINEKVVRDCIAAVYDAANDELSWDRTVEILRIGFGGKSAILHRVDLVSSDYSVLGWGQLSADAMAPYLAHYYAEDLWTLAVSRKPRGLAYSGELLVDRPTLHRSGFFNEFLRPMLGVDDVVGGTPSGSATLVTPLGIHLAEGRPLFGEAERRAMQLILPHIGRAIAIRDGFMQHLQLASGAVSALQQLGDGVVLCDRHARVVFANDVARAWATGGAAGLAIDTRIRATHPAADAALKGMIAAAATKRQAARAMRLSRRDDGALFLLVAPLGEVATQKQMAGSAEVLVLISSLQNRPAMRADRLIELFGLSKAESEVAMALAAGERLDDIAARRGVRISTVRSQLTTILAKTGTSRQIDLIRLVNALPRLREDGPEA